jgi:apolipoprotein N-acyltransferase
MSFFKTFVILLFFGALAALSFAPFNLWYCGFIMLFPLFYVLELGHYGIKKSILLGYLFTLSLNFFISYWLLHTITIYGHIHWTLAGVIFLLFILISCTRYAFFILLIQLWNLLVKQPDIKFYKLVSNRYFSWTFYWAVSEYFGWQLFHVLGANHAGGDFYLIQSADLGGIYVVSLFWFLANLLLYDILKMFLLRKQSPFFKTFFKNKTMIFTSILLVIIHIYGFFSARYYDKKNLNYEKRIIALVQGNAPMAFEANRSQEDQILGTLESQVNLTERVLQKSTADGKIPELVVWPESSVPFLSLQSPAFNQAIKKIQNRYKTAMIVNDIYVEYTLNRQSYYNNLWLIDKDGNPIDFYHKIQLLPFGEFIPFADLYPEAYNLVPEISGFSAGKEKKTLNLNSMNIIPSICYELLPPTFTLDFFNESGKKAQIIINITNDTWFGLTTENAQHIKESSIRAIELRLPIIRAANSGISAYIDTTGTIHEPTKSNTQETRVYEVPIPDKSHSLYSLVGLWPFKIFLITGFLIWSAALFGYYKFSTERPGQLR